MDINFSTVLRARGKVLQEPEFDEKFDIEKGGFPILGMKSMTLGSAVIEALSSPGPEEAKGIKPLDMIKRDKLADDIYDNLQDDSAVMEVKAKELIMMRDVIGLKFKSIGKTLGAAHKLLED